MSVREDRYFCGLDSGAWETRAQAYHELFREGQGAVATLVAGAMHPRPRVRAACIALMDHLYLARGMRLVNYSHVQREAMPQTRNKLRRG